jgi:hypothetical protein
MGGYVEVTRLYGRKSADPLRLGVKCRHPPRRKPFGVLLFEDLIICLDNGGFVFRTRRTALTNPTKQEVFLRGFTSILIAKFQNPHPHPPHFFSLPFPADSVLRISWVPCHPPSSLFFCCPFFLDHPHLFFLPIIRPLFWGGVCVCDQPLGMGYGL